MPTTFQYSVRDRTGQLVTGTLEAESPSMVVERLKSMGYAPVSISEANAGMKKELSIPGFGKRVKIKDLAIMARQFATMVNSGLSLLRALTILTDETENKELARVLGVVRADIESGSSLSSAMGKHPRVFPPLMVNMTKAGEVGGFLDTVMVQIADNFEAEVKLRSKVKSAMTYPVVVFVIAVIAVIGMLLFVVPIFAKMFKDMDSKLPAPTQFLVTLSGAMKWMAPLGFVLLIVGFATWRRVKHLDSVRAVVDPFRLKVPIFGSLFQKIALSRFSRNLGTMLRSGVPILQSLEIVGATSGNYVIEQAVKDVQESVRQGDPLTRPLSEHPVFPAMAIQMMAVGEDTGALDAMLHKIGDFYDQEVESTTEALTSLIEPLMIAFLGGIVGSMIVVLYLPIFSLMNNIK